MEVFPRLLRLPVGSPVAVTAVHSEVEAHEMAVTATVATDPVHGTDQALAPPVGLVEVYSLPVLVPATHSVVVGQATAVKRAPVTTALVQALAPPVGLVEV